MEAKAQKCLISKHWKWMISAQCPQVKAYCLLCRTQILDAFLDEIFKPFFFGRKIKIILKRFENSYFKEGSISITRELLTWLSFWKAVEKVTVNFRASKCPLSSLAPWHPLGGLQSLSWGAAWVGMMGQSPQGGRWEWWGGSHTQASVTAGSGPVPFDFRNF